MTDAHYEDATVTLHHGDCLDVLRELPDNSVDSVVTDPPYGLGFMGKEWDKIAQDASRPPSADETDARFNNKFPRTGKGPAATKFDGLAFQLWCVEWTTECLRVLKPGGHLLAFGGTRTWHRLACAVEDAGFEIRDSIAWVYGSGFPKSLDVSKAIDKAAGAEREVVGVKTGPGYSLTNGNGDHRTYSRGLGNTGSGEAECAISAPATPDAERWQGWGTALKPAFEPVVVARKPLVGTVAANVLAHGTGALNVDGCRVASDEDTARKPAAVRDTSAAPFGRGMEMGGNGSPLGRWPANVILDESQAAALDEQSGVQRDGVAVKRNGVTSNGVTGWGKVEPGTPDVGHGGEGGASRFFYVAKADASERVRVDGIAHPTVKPLALIRWLVRLVTPPGGTVLELFAGSGTTVEACILEGFKCVAIEREADYLPLIVQRINRRRDPVAAIRAAHADDLGLFEGLA